jgi:pimeloyl-ACP methyl ester carboxylesterase
MNTVISQDGTTIAYDRSGDGPALILVGGAFQYRAFDPRTGQLAELLAPHFTVYHYDRRGRGDSGDTAPYAIEREIEDVAALVEEAGGSAYLFGMSSGAPLALDAAPFIVDDSRPPVHEDYLARLTEFVSTGQRGDAVTLFLTEAVGVPAEYVAPMRDTPMWAGFEAVAHTLPYDGAIMDGTLSGKALPAQRWASVKIPTLVADGGASGPAMHSAAQALADLLPDARRRTLDGQEHAVDPAILAPVLIDFFTN